MILLKARHFGQVHRRYSVVVSLCCFALAVTSGCKPRKSTEATPARQQSQGAVPQGDIPVGVKSGAQSYDLLTDVDCDLKFRSISQDSDRNIVAASGVELICDGQPIKLVDGKIKDNGLETADFGRFMVKPLYTIAILVTPDQDSKLKSALAPNADLCSASEFGYISRVEALLAAKVDVNARNCEGSSTALMLASEEGNLEVVQALMAAGANVNARDDGNYTALIRMLAGWNPEKIKIFDILLEAGASVNARGSDGTTALMQASCNRDEIEVVRALLAAGADVNVVRENGDTPLKLASGNGNGEIVQLLKSAVPAAKRKLK
jgi:uncharacterized protein